MANIDLNELSPAAFPKAESESFEFKSSKLDFDRFADKLSVAVSAFANSGGGCLIWGADNSGNVDGGVSPKSNKQDLRDWIDKVVNVSQPPEYYIRIYDDAEGRGVLEPGKVIAAVSVPASSNAPHQAKDGKYYLRGGTHSNPATHFLVESLFARRQVMRPVLSHIFRTKPTRAYLLQLGVVALTSAPAVDVRLNISPLKGGLETIHSIMPLHIPVVNSATPFFMDISTSCEVKQNMGEGVVIEIDYKDIAGKEYGYRSKGPLIQEMPTIFIDDANSDLVKELRQMNTHFWDLIQDLKDRNTT